MNWKTYVATQNAKTFVLPPGWDSRETIAEQLECSPEKVREHLQPGIAAREIEVKQFPVWDSGLGRKVIVTAYRKIAPSSSADPAAPRQASPRAHKAWTDADTAHAHKLRRAGKSWREIGLVVGHTAEAVRKWLKYHP